MNRSFKSIVVSFVLALSGAAYAQNPLEVEAGPKPELTEIPAEAKEPVELVKKYLEAVKAKKWAEAKKLTHARTMDAIAQRKKKLGNEDHPMAPWFYEKGQYYLKAFKVTGVKPGPLGTFIVETSEDNFQVEEKGIAEGDMATYLVGKSGGKWVIADKKRGVTFTNDSVKFGYRGYFDKVEQAEADE